MRFIIITGGERSGTTYLVNLDIKGVASELPNQVVAASSNGQSAKHPRNRNCRPSRCIRAVIRVTNHRRGLPFSR